MNCNVAVVIAILALVVHVEITFWRKRLKFAQRYLPDAC